MEREFDLYEERRPRTWLWILLLLIAFIGGAAAMGYAVVRDAQVARLLHLVPAEQAKAEVQLARRAAAIPAPQPATTAPPPGGQPGVEAAMDVRLSTLEEKVDDIEEQAREATGDASRAEGLLVTFAARRALDRGVELGYIEGLLRQRFGDSQPQAVATILSASRQPVTLADLQNGLDAAAPALSAGGVPQQSWWQSFRQQVASLIVVRRSGEPSTQPGDRVARAQRLLDAGQVDGALAEISRLPDHSPADKWIAAARRYIASRVALDQIETAALLAPTSPPPKPAAPQPAPTPTVITPAPTAIRPGAG